MFKNKFKKKLLTAFSFPERKDNLKEKHLLEGFLNRR